MSENRFGAMPPPGLEWQIGKTAAAIDFVNEAESAFLTRTDLTEREAQALRTYVRMLKDGHASLNERETLDGWLERLRDHHP